MHLNVYLYSINNTYFKIKNIMYKKIIMFALILVLFSCSSNNDTTANPTTNEIFAFKQDYSNFTYIPRLVKVNPTNGTETDIIVTTVGESAWNLVFNKETNEIVGNSTNDKLIKFNLTSNTYSIISLNLSNNLMYGDLILDNNYNLYAFKQQNPTVTDTYLPRLVKVNPTNGSETDIILTTLGTEVWDLVFNKATNEIIGRTNNDKLIKFNLTLNTYSIVSLNLSDNLEYSDFIIDNNHNLYAFKYQNPTVTSTYIPRLVKINQTNGTETDIILTALGESAYGIAYNNETNEIIGNSNNNKLIKFNLTSNTYSTVNLTVPTGTYGDLVIK